MSQKSRVSLDNKQQRSKIHLNNENNVYCNNESYSEIVALRLDVYTLNK